MTSCSTAGNNQNVSPLSTPSLTTVGWQYAHSPLSAIPAHSASIPSHEPQMGASKCSAHLPSGVIRYPIYRRARHKCHGCSSCPSPSSLLAGSSPNTTDSAAPSKQGSQWHSLHVYVPAMLGQGSCAQASCSSRWDGAWNTRYIVRLQSSERRCQ